MSSRIQWDKRKIIDALRERRDRKLPLNISEILRSQPSLGGAIARHYGSHDKALRAARIDPAKARLAVSWDKAKIIAALKERHSAGFGTRIADLQQSNARLCSAIRHHFDSHHQALEAAGITPVLPFRWTKELIVKALQDRRDRELELNSAGVSKSNSGLAGAILKLFSSHSAALLAAGIDPAAIRDLHYWSKERVIAALRSRHARGLEVTSTAIYRQERGLDYGIESQFGSYDAARQAAGVPSHLPKPPDPVWNKKLIIAALRDRRKNGKALSQNAIRCSDNSLLRAVYRHYKTFAAALGAARIKVPAVPKPSFWDKTIIIEKLQQRRAKGLDLNHFGIRKSDPHLGAAITNHFGSHDVALRAAGIDPADARHNFWWDKDKIVAALQQRIQLKFPMNFIAIAKSDPRLASAIHGHFGTHAAALTAVGIDPASVRQVITWDRQKVIEALRNRHKDGLSLTTGEVRKSDIRLHGAIRRYFGNHEAAVTAAGFAPQEAGRKSAGGWTEELVLQKLREMDRDGQDLRYTAMKNGSQPLFFAAKKLFGSYVNAVREAGINYWDMSQDRLAKSREAAAANADDAGTRA